VNNFADLLLMLKARLSVEAVDTSRDSELTALLNGSIVLCENYLDDIISRREVSEKWLKVQFPKRLRYSMPGDFVSVTVDGVDPGLTWKIVNQDAYGFLQVVDGSSVFDGQEVVATYQAGFAECPYDLMLAICDVALSIDSKAEIRTNGQLVSKETITGIGSVEYDTESTGPIPEASRHILNMYRRPRV
jgi:hypothetical protein